MLCRVVKIDLFFERLSEHSLCNIAGYLRLEDLCAFIKAYPPLLTAHGMQAVWSFRFMKDCPSRSWLADNSYLVQTVDFFIIGLKQGVYSYDSASMEGEDDTPSSLYIKKYMDLDFSHLFPFLSDRRRVMWSWGCIESSISLLHWHEDGGVSHNDVFDEEYFF